MSNQSVPKRQRGFSLFEIAVVLVVISIVLAGLLPFITESMKSDAMDTTIDRMEEIQKAVLAFRNLNNRLPCPADITMRIDETNGYFGKEATPMGTCINVTAPNASFGPFNEVVGGMVPTKTLHLPDEYAFDGWGRRIAYHVDRRMTQDASGPPTHFTAGNDGSLEVYDQTDNVRTLVAAYVLVSHGPNGHGGYLISGSQFSSDSENIHESENCDCDAVLAADANGTALGGIYEDGYDSTFFQHMSVVTTPGDEDTRYDDIVRYLQRNQLN